jgi:hypothetical protein
VLESKHVLDVPFVISRTAIRRDLVDYSGAQNSAIPSPDQPN